MKKYLYFLLFGVVLTLTACGGNAASNNSTSTNDSNTNEVASGDAFADLIALFPAKDLPFATEWGQAPAGKSIPSDLLKSTFPARVV